MSHFTNNVEFSHLESVKVGGNLDFIEQTFGIAKVIKPSKTIKDLEYRYYTDRKYILAIAAQKSRVVAYQVVSLRRSFDPSLPFSEFQLGSFSYSDYSDSFDDYRLDNANITYYMESHSLGRAGLFLNQYFVYVGYGADYSELKDAGTINKRGIATSDQLVVFWFGLIGQEKTRYFVNQLNVVIDRRKPSVQLKGSESCINQVIRVSLLDESLRLSVCCVCDVTIQCSAQFSSDNLFGQSVVNMAFA
ncbi:ETEC_3214 domain-containing protein [Marinomonas flavescens]|uniref:ETEC_3214 domain-containing protein n=1 Tax=Marinomonas flavescens TaxID=2529379 RepID=UPI0030B83122